MTKLTFTFVTFKYLDSNVIKITTEMIEITIKIEIMRTDKIIIVIGIMDVVILFHQEDNTIPHHGTGHSRAIPIKIGTVVIANK